MSRTIDLADHGKVLVAVLSDTHGKPHPSLFPLLKRSRPDVILHAGDVGPSDLLSEFEAFGPTAFVRGNMDPSAADWPDTLSLRIVLAETRKLDLLLVHIGLTHRKLMPEVWNLLRKEPARMVVFGHSHMPFVGSESGIALFNPGSAGPPRMGLPIAMGWLELTADGVCFRHTDLKTGREWKPPTTKP
jgi:putative phosphoesterase